MTEETKYRRLGVFVFVALALLFGILFLLGGRSLFQPTLVFETYFNDSVAGLDVGSPVRFRGVPLGQVSEILPSWTVRMGRAHQQAPGLHRGARHDRPEPRLDRTYPS